MPAWLIEVLREVLPQFPMVAIVIGVFVLAEWRLRQKEIRMEERADKNRKEEAEREDKLRAEARQDRDAEIRRFQESQEKLLAAKDEQIKNFANQVENLTKQLSTLMRKLSG